MTDPEIIRADPSLRRTVIIVALVLFFSFALLYGLLGDPFEWVWGRLLQDIEALAEVDPALAARKASRIVIATLVGAWIAYLGIAAYSLILGIRMWRAGQWPLPNARVIADTKVKRGAPLRVLAAAATGVPLIALAPLLYYSIEIWRWAARSVA